MLTPTTYNNNNTLTSSQPQPRKPSLVIDRLLNSGKFSVFHAHMPSLNLEYALKAFPTDTTSQYYFAREKRFFQHFNHPNIIKYISEANICIQHQDVSVMVLEYAPYGDFYDLMASGKLVDECLLREYFHQLVAGLEYLHTQGVAHFDIKPENMLIGQDFQLKLTDFDQSQSMKSSRRVMTGTVGYRAPEVIQGACSNIFAADVYSAGVTLYVLVVKELPFVEKKENDKIMLSGYEMFCEDNKTFWDQKAIQSQNTILFDDDFRELINGMLKRNPEERMSLEQVKASNWYKGWRYDKEDFVRQIDRMFC